MLCTSDRTASPSHISAFQYPYSSGSFYSWSIHLYSLIRSRSLTCPFHNVGLSPGLFTLSQYFCRIVQPNSCFPSFVAGQGMVTWIRLLLSAVLRGRLGTSARVSRTRGIHVNTQICEITLQIYFIGTTTLHNSFRGADNQICRRALRCVSTLKHVQVSRKKIYYFELNDTSMTSYCV